MRRFLLLALAFALTIVGRSYAEEELFLQGQTFPSFAGLGPFIHDTPGVLMPGKFTLQTQEMWFNTFRYDAHTQTPDIDFITDIEGIQWASKFRLGLLPSLEVQAEIQGWGLFPGIMDGFLDTFHHWFGFPNQKRDVVPMNQFHLYFYKNGKIITNDTQPAFGLTQWSTALKLGDNKGAALLAWVKGPVPSPDSWYLTSTFSTGAALIYGDRWNFELWNARWTLLWGLSQGVVLQQPDTTISSIFPNRLVLPTGGAHLGLQLENGWTILFEGSAIRSPWVTDSYYLGAGSGEIHMGIKGALDSQWRFEAAIVEEFLTWGTMEVGYQTGFTWAP